MAKSPSGKKSKDVAVLQGPTEDGEGARIIRFRDGTVSAGEVRPMKEGQALNQQELLRLKPMKNDPAICEVEVLHEPTRRKSKAGPAQVATDTYRRNWSQVFGKRGDAAKPDEPSKAAPSKAAAGKQDWSMN